MSICGEDGEALCLSLARGSWSQRSSSWRLLPFLPSVLGVGAGTDGWAWHPALQGRHICSEHPKAGSCRRAPRRSTPRPAALWPAGSLPVRSSRRAGGPAANARQALNLRLPVYQIPIGKSLNPSTYLIRSAGGQQCFWWSDSPQTREGAEGRTFQRHLRRHLHVPGGRSHARPLAPAAAPLGEMWSGPVGDGVGRRPSSLSLGAGGRLFTGPCGPLGWRRRSPWPLGWPRAAPGRAGGSRQALPQPAASGLSVALCRSRSTPTLLTAPNWSPRWDFASRRGVRALGGDAVPGKHSGDGGVTAQSPWRCPASSSDPPCVPCSNLVVV